MTRLALIFFALLVSAAPSLAADAWVAEVTVDLDEVSASTDLAEIMTAMTSAEVLDADNGACTFSSRIGTADSGSKRMDIELDLKSKKEGRVNCTKYANEWLKQRMRDLTAYRGLKVVSLEVAN